MKIGLRIMKTSISVFICLAIFIGLKCLEYIPGTPKNMAMMIYNPFFAGIATAYSLHNNKQKSVEQAKNRCVASFIGGILGIVVILFYELIFKTNWPSLTNSTAVDLIIPYLLVVLTTILVIWVAVRLDQRPAVFVSILTFLSCTVNPNTVIANELGTWMFGVNRITSTIIGVLIALAVNLFQLPRFHKNKDMLFAIEVEGILKADSDKLTDYMHYKFNSLVANNINVTLFTTRPPVTFMHIFDDTKVSLPIICCNGSAIYDVNKKTYLAKEEILYEDSLQLDKYLDELNVTPMKNYIINDCMYIYCKSIDNEGERLYIDEKKNSPYCNTFVGVNNNNDNVLYYLLIEEVNKANEIINYIENGPLGELFKVQIYDYFNKDSKLNPDLKYVKIYSKKIEKLQIVKDYCSKNNFRLVGLTTDQLANNLLENSDISVTYSTNDLGKEYADIILNSDTYNELFKYISKMYYSKKY